METTKETACYLEQILETAPHKTVAVRLPYKPFKMDKT